MGESFNELFEESGEAQACSSPVPVVPPTNNKIKSITTSEDFIFCSECGHKIKSHSKYCRFCGAKVDEEYAANEVENHNTLSTDDSKSVDKSHSSIQERIISTSKPIEVKIKSESTVKKSSVANEIVANLKMIAIALLLWIVYIVGFTCYRAKDASPLTDTNSYYGESCYDPGVMSGGWEFSWEKHLATKLNYISTKKNKYGISDFNPMSTSDYLYLSNLSPDKALEEAKRQAKVKNVSDDHFAQLMQEAKDDAKRDRDSFNEEISSIRKYAYEEELHKHMLWAAIISLGLMVIGRYFILACKWISRNKTN